ncbi:hypothetical protein G5714_002773 [Onychostoma macrolepis]|uniref:Uncharacterized protein n=1 Tax=Onychostoma macrolepis TaxID=369639 RepID=A0A7J6D8R3_9TELE|nr:hypothetical protein G5714_002773 [Onychostoma macrolepis]
MQEKSPLKYSTVRQIACLDSSIISRDPEWCKGKMKSLVQRFLQDKQLAGVLAGRGGLLPGLTPPLWNVPPRGVTQRHETGQSCGGGVSHRGFTQRFLFGSQREVLEQTLVRGFTQQFLFGQPEAGNGADTEAGNGADTGKRVHTAVPLRQPEAGNGADTGKRGSHSNSSSDSQRQVTEQTLVRGVHTAVPLRTARGR